MQTPLWLSIALAEDGVREIPGARDNARILEYLRTTGSSLHDETPWCSAFVQWCLGRAGVAGTGEANARSWLGWGQATLPVLGCIVVFSRDEAGPKAGHVGFYVAQSDDHVLTFGGNQHNRVRLEPRDRGRVLGYRWPTQLK